MAEKVYIPIFLDWNESTKRLNATEKGRLIDALVSYAKSEEDWEENLKGNERFLADELRLKIDRFFELSAKRADAGSKGGKQTQANASKVKQNQANTATRTRTKTNTSTSTNIRKDISNDISKRHPTIAEVKAYCDERNNTINPEAFIDYYTANGWKVGKNPMKDWKAAVRQWERTEKPKSVPKLEETHVSGTDEIKRLLEAM